MRPLQEIRRSERLRIIRQGEDGFWAEFIYPPINPDKTCIIASWGGGWEHVSFSFRNRCPSWDEMCLMKDIFWSDEECVVQYHPPKSEYVNRHPFCLHLWKPIGQEYPMPPKIFVG